MNSDEPSADLGLARTRRRNLIGALLAILFIVAAGIAFAAIRHDSPKSLATFSDDPLVTCGGNGPAFHASRLNGPTGAEHADDPIARALLADLEKPHRPPTNPGGPPITSWRVVVQTKTEALFVGGDDEHRSSNRYNRTGGTWKWAGSGSCNALVIAQPGLDEVRVELDRRHPIEPTTTELHLIAHGSACNGGTIFNAEHVKSTVVRADQHRLVVAIAGRPTRSSNGFQLCGAPISGIQLTVRLPAPVGGRQVLDGTRFPYEPISS